jgi:hypothetical protein
MLRALSLAAFARVEAFCLRAVAQSLPSIAVRCPLPPVSWRPADC